MICWAAAVVPEEEPFGNVGVRGDDNGVGLGVDPTMLHIGHPARGANGLVGEDIEVELRCRQGV